MPSTPIIAVTAGEPAGIGPDIVTALATRRFAARLVVFGNLELLRDRAMRLDSPAHFRAFDPGGDPESAAGTIEVVDIPLAAPVSPGRLDAANANHVLDMLTRAGRGCLDGRFAAMVTAPISKEIINRAGRAFSGHTEYLAALCGDASPVMLLHSGRLRVALATTHLPLRAVADAISANLVEQIVTTLDDGLRTRFAIARPRIKVCGLNPHAGENGYLGREEIDIIAPALAALGGRGIAVSGPWPADTLFTPAGLADADAVLAMYHDQGLPVLKHAGFHQAVNTTLGLPILRTSVDHGTALDLAGSGRAAPDSLFAAIESAIEQARNLARGRRRAAPPAMS